MLIDTDRASIVWRSSGVWGLKVMVFLQAVCHVA